MNNYKMLEIRTSVMQEEFQTAQNELFCLQEQLLEKEQSQVTLNQEKQDCLERLAKVQRELKLIENFEREQA